MSKEVYVQGRRVRLDPAKAVGKGGEADVFLLDRDTVVKVFKQPDHPDFTGFPQEQQAAMARIEEHQKKLRAFPKGLPAEVISPLELATDRRGDRILGYTMRFLSDSEVLLRYAERPFRSSGIDNNQIRDIFQNMHEPIREMHTAGVVIGDFNDLNVLVKGPEGHFIDADSFQFGGFLCRLYTEKFVDPVLCDPNGTRPTLVKPHTPASDWYAYNVMLMQCLVFCGPYGGVFKPGKRRKNIPHVARPLARVTVFDKDVKYPKPALPYGHLPDELLHHFHLVFEKDERTEFPLRILQRFRWTRCVGCGAEHGRPNCPACQKVSPETVVQAIQVRGKVTATQIFKTRGEILFGAFQGGELYWLYRDGDELKREDGRTVARGISSQNVRYRIRGPETLLGTGSEILVIHGDDQIPRERLTVDRYGNLPVFDANGRRKFWLEGGVLQRDGTLGPERVGDVLEGQTLFWVGSTFGFGFYRAGDLSVVFVFDVDHRGINDNVKLPRMRGHLLDATCFFSSDRCWFFTAFKQEGRILNRCTVIRRDGSVEASTETDQGDGSWLSDIRGKCAAGAFLFAVTDEGLVRVEVSGNSINKTAEYPDTEPFVDAGCQLFPAKEGLYTIGRHAIRLLKIG